MPPDHLHRIERATAERTAFHDGLKQAERAWRKAITDAVAADVSPSDIAAAAGISRARVYQLRDNRR